MCTGTWICLCAQLYLGGKYQNCPVLKEVLNSGTRVLKQIAAEGKNEDRGRKLKPLWRHLCQKILSGLKYEYCNCWRCTFTIVCTSYCTFNSLMVLVNKIDQTTPYCIFKLQYSFLARAVTTFGQLWIIKYEARNCFWEVAMIIPPKPDSKFSRVRHLGKCAYVKVAARATYFLNFYKIWLLKKTVTGKRLAWKRAQDVTPTAREVEIKPF